MKVKIWKKLALALAVAVAVPTVPMVAPQMVTESVAASLNKKSVTMEVGETYQLKLSDATGKIKWKSKDSSIAAVNNDGKITANAPGKTKIVAKYDGKKYKCKVTVEAAPTPTPTQTPTPDPTPVQTETVVYNQNGIKITYLGLENKNNIYYEARFKIENSSSKHVFISSDDSSINGYMYYIGSLGDVDAGKNAIKNFHLSFSSMQEKGIDPTSTLNAEFTWDIWEYNQYDKIDNSTKCYITF